MAERERYEERRRQWAAFHRWEAEQAPEERSPAVILANIGAIREWLPPEARLADPDPEKKGIQVMRRAPARLGEAR
jgi:hypothetical protein